MKFSLVTILSLVATSTLAAPGGGGGGDGGHCDRYEYKNKCPYCPYKPNHHPRELTESPELEDRDITDSGELEDRDITDSGELEERGGGGHDKVCYKDCPREWQTCKVWDYQHDQKQSYSAFYQQDYSCPKKFKFNVVIKIEERNNKQYFRVDYSNRSDRKNNIDSCNLGVYQSPQQTYNPSQLNYNQYCQGSSCSFPVEKLPGYPHICGKEIWVAVGNDRCYKNFGKNNNGYHQATKYVKVKINCKNNDDREHRKCREYCCCPH